MNEQNSAEERGRKHCMDSSPQYLQQNAIFYFIFLWEAPVLGTKCCSLHSCVDKGQGKAAKCSAQEYC